MFIYNIRSWNCQKLAAEQATPVRLGGIELSIPVQPSLLPPPPPPLQLCWAGRRSAPALYPSASGDTVRLAHTDSIGLGKTAGVSPLSRVSWLN